MSEEKKLGCLFYPKIKCNVRMEMQQTRLLQDRITPIKESEEDKVMGKIVGGVVQVMSAEYAALSHFCSMCVKKHIEDLKYRKKMIDKLNKKGLLTPPPEMNLQEHLQSY